LARIPVIIIPALRSLQIDETSTIPDPFNVNRVATESGRCPAGTQTRKELHYDHREMTLAGIN
jgi:hypothetical protein